MKMNEHEATNTAYKSLNYSNLSEDELTQLVAAPLPLEEEYRILKAINNALHQLLAYNDVNKALEAAFRIICEATHCDGLMLFKYASIEPEFVHAEAVFTIRQVQNVWQLLPTQMIHFPVEVPFVQERFESMLHQGATTVVTNQQTPPKLKAFLKELDINSYITFRIMLDDEVYGGMSLITRAPVIPHAQAYGALLVSFAQSVGNLLARKEVEKQLEAQRDYFRQIIDVMPNPIFIKNRQGIITLINRAMANANELQPEDMIGKPFEIFMKNKVELEQVLAETNEIIQTRKPKINIYKKLTSCNNKKHYLQTSKIPLLDSNNEVIEIITILNDLTELKNNERRLVEQREFSQNITNTIPDAILLVDYPNRRLNYHNMQFPVLGFSEKEFPNLYELLMSRLHTDEREVPDNFYQKLQESEPNAIIESYGRFQHKDGHWRHFYGRARVVSRNKDNCVKEYLIIIQDITELKKAERALQHSESILKATINSLPDLKFRLRKDGTYLDFYQSGNEDITPYAPADVIIGNRVQDVMPGKLGFIFLEKIQAAIQERTVKMHEYELKLPGGAIEYREARFSPINEEEVISVVRNISTRKRAEKALKESQERYLNFIKHSHDGIYYMNCGQPIPIHLPYDEINRLYYKYAYIEECNESMARMYGTTVEALKGTTAIALHGGEHFKENVESFKDLVKNNFRVSNAETIEPDVNGNLKYFLNNAVGIIENDHLIGFWGTQIDITERKQAQLRERTRTYVLELLSKGAALATILKAIVQGVEQYKAGIICSILLLDNEKKRLWTACAPSLPDFYNDAINGTEIGIGVGSCGTAAYTGARVVVADIQTHPYWENYKELGAHADLRACWSEPIKDSSGNILGSFAIYHRNVSTPAQDDIELIKQAADLVSIVLNKFHTEDSLRANKERWKFAIEGSNDGIWDWNILTNKVYYSPRWKEMLGFAEHEIKDSLQDWSRLVHPEDMDLINHNLQKTFSGDMPIFMVEHRILCKDGTYKWILARGKILMWNEDGTPARMVGTHTDISERKQFEQDLQENRSLLKAIVNALPDLKFRVNKEGLFLDYYESEYENEAPIIPPVEFIKKNIYEVLPSFVAEVGLNSINQAIEQRQVNTFQYYMPMGDEVSYFEGRVSPLGEAEAIVAVRNITDQKKAEIALQEKLRELDEKNQELTLYIDSNFQLEHFAYIASHDLREPIRTVHSFAQLLKKKYEHRLDEDGVKSLNFIITGAMNMNQLIEDLLTYSRVNSEAHVVQTIIIKDLITEVTDSISHFIKEKNATIDLEEVPLVIQANKLKIKQLFQNLITNAIKFHHLEKMPHVHISGIEQDEYWLFEIKDNGIGVPDTMKDKIFQLFKKIHYQPEHYGTGIGLALCKRIIDQHRGEIWVESQPGLGSSFYFTIKKP